jgi:hypothetical protein
MDSNIKLKIKKLQEINDLSLLKYELYSIFVYLILSKEEFKNNKDINTFLGTLNINFKEYVMKSRTLIIAKVLRLIEKGDTIRLQLYKDILVNIYLKKLDENYPEKPKIKKQNTSNYMSDILNKYSRNKG